MKIIYCSETGFTRQYAELLHQKTGLPLLPLEEAERTLEPGTAAVFLGWLCAGSLQGWKRAGKRFDVRCVCAVGMAAGYDTAALAKRSGIADIPVFYLRGGYDRTKLRGVHKAMMGVAEKFIRIGAGKDEQGREMLAAVEHGANWVTEEQLRGVADFLNGN